MKIKPLLPVIVLLGSPSLLSSCVTAPAMQPRANVESVERQSSPTPTPNVGQHEAGRNAVDYSNDRVRRGYGYGGYGGSGGYPYGY